MTIARCQAKGCSPSEGIQQSHGQDQTPINKRLAKDANSGLYTGVLSHHRYQPFTLRFRQRLLMLYLDIDEIPSLFFAPRWWSPRAYGLASFRRSDFYGNPTQPLDTCIRELVLARLGVQLDGPIRLLAHPRCWGLCFNPIAIYYCFDASDKSLQAIVAEVTNTPWGQRHQYVLQPTNDLTVDDVTTSNATPCVTHTFKFAKALHVSPFYPMDMTYHWRCNTPSDADDSSVFVHIDLHRGGKRQFAATLSLKRQAATSSNLDRALLRFPLMPWRVVVNIYWQAMKLWLRGARYYPKPD